MANQLTWIVHTAFLDAGSVPFWVSPFEVEINAGQTDSIFSMHVKPNDIEGCSLFRVEWFNFNDNTEVYATVDMLFDHSDNSSCSVGLDEFTNIKTTISPNPAIDFTTLSIYGAEQQVNIQVMDMLGKTISSDSFNPFAGNSYEFDTSAMKNGIYFVSIIGEGDILKTMKLVVIH